MTAPLVHPRNPDAAPRARTLSKSDFIRARDCAAKLYFRENGYPDARVNDPYMAMLAEGGYMVEALAKAHYRDGIQLEYGGDVAANFARTRAALESPNVTLFEATLLVGRRQARVDILEKRGNVLRVIEVKAKSFDGTEHARQLAQNRSGVFLTKKQPYRVNSDWDEKLADLTFQVVLLEQVMPGFVIQPVLALVDKSKATGLDNVPGYFELVRRPSSDGTMRLHTGRFTGSAEDLEQLDLVTEVDVAREVAIMHDEIAELALRFEARLDAEFEAHTVGVELGSHCDKCEFRTPGETRSGFGKCWGDLAAAQPHLLDLYRVGTAKAPDGTHLVPYMLGRHSASLLEAPVEGLISGGSQPRRQCRAPAPPDRMHAGRLHVRWAGAARQNRGAPKPDPLHRLRDVAPRAAIPSRHAAVRPRHVPVERPHDAHVGRTAGAPRVAQQRGHLA